MWTKHGKAIVFLDWAEKIKWSLKVHLRELVILVLINLMA